MCSSTDNRILPVTPGSWVLLLLFLSVPYLCLTTNWALLHRHSPQTHPPSISHVTYVVRRSEEHQQGKQSGHQPSLISLSRRCLNKWKGLKKFMNPSSWAEMGVPLSNLTPSLLVSKLCLGTMSKIHCHSPSNSSTKHSTPESTSLILQKCIQCHIMQKHKEGAKNTLVAGLEKEKYLVKFKNILHVIYFIILFDSTAHQKKQMLSLSVQQHEEGLHKKEFQGFT
ncbi:unnamed protein product [Lactuca virosa]|uniref:Uncharacterized protein n=1 Tax=Lactuca virosa TaxID=75947 RepID=A0AAU9MV80_9ASTR|nr:unnamed protein product [Lactuca virosa]